MARLSVHPGEEMRSAAAAVEMAIALPALVAILVFAADFARGFYHLTTITNCARNAALYERDVYSPLRNTYADFKQVALDEAKNLNPALLAENITRSAPGLTDALGQEYVEVTVTYDFQPITGYLGIGTITMQRTVRMRIAPAVPDAQ